MLPSSPALLPVGRLGSLYPSVPPEPQETWPGLQNTLRGEQHAVTEPCPPKTALIHDVGCQQGPAGDHCRHVDALLPLQGGSKLPGQFFI